MKKVHSAGSFLDRKYTRQYTVLRPYKTTQVKIIKEGNYERRKHFCKWFLWAVVHDIVHDPELMKPDSISVGVSVFKTIGVLVCGVPLLLHK
jgi:hypothetical protein